MKITFIVTVLNEEATIRQLLDSLVNQSLLPNEVIIVDGGSTDTTVSIIKNYESRIEKNAKFKLLIKKGNRAVGRNEAASIATGNIIACSDAGCILDRDWVKLIVKPFDDPNVDVVAGYYKGKPQNLFQKCLIPYVLIMPDRVDPRNFLPATRSIAFTKLIWEKTGGFNEKFSNNEDYVFAKILKRINAKIVFTKSAFVYWLPRKNLYDAFIMFYRFAVGDAEAKIFRPKVLLIFLRYILGILILFLAIIRKDKILTLVLLLMICFYILWAAIKNYKYIKDIKAIFILPVLQIASDIAVIAGTIVGLYKIWDTKKMQ